MADSLLIDGRFELLGGGQKSTLPQCSGATFRLAPGFDLSAPQPTTAAVISLLLDGERPIGLRASNRTITLPVIVMADNRTTLAAAVEALLQGIDQDQFKMTWTRDGGVPVVFDCFKATPATVNYNLLNQQSAMPTQALSISFPALPYLHSDQPVTLTFDSPFVGTVAPPSSIELDNYATVSGAGWTRSSQHVLDSFSAFWSDGSGGYPVYSKAVASTDISALSAVTFWLGLATDFESYWSWNGGNVTFSVTLTDHTGDTVTFGATQFCAASNTPGVPNWQQITVPLPDDATFDWGAVTAYSVSCWSRTTWFSGRQMQASVYLNAFTVAPASASTPASTRGWLATLYGIQGSAHAPLAVQFQLLASGLTTTTFNTPGPFSYGPVASGVTNGRAQLWGPGGIGAGLSAAGQGGGASGGGYGEEPSYPLVAGNTYSGVIGTPGSSDTTFDTKQALTSPNSDFEGGIGTWTTSGNANPSATTAQAHGGTGSLQMSSQAAGNMQAGNIDGANILTQGTRADAGHPVTVSAWFRAATAARSVNVGIVCYDASGASLGAVRGSNVTDSTSGWTQATATVTPLASTAWVRLDVQVVATAAGGEVHYVDDAAMSVPAVKATKGTSATAGSSTGATATDTSTNSIHHKGGDGANGTGSGGTPALVQSKQFTFTGSTGSGSLASPTGAGNCLVVIVEGFGGSANPSVSGVTLGGSADHFSQVDAETANGFPPFAFAWLDPGCAGSQTSIAVTLTGGSGTLGATVTVMEWSNIATSSPLDQATAGDSLTSSSFNSGTTGTTSQASEVAIGAASSYANSGTPSMTGPTSPWTNLATQSLSISSQQATTICGYKVLSSTGTVSYAGTISGGSDGYNALVITLKGAASSQAGGGGSSAGTSADGNPGSGPTGGSAPTGGAAGGTAPGAAGNGVTGSAPGGGGSGALSTGSAETGGPGGGGQAKITVSSTVLSSFKTLVAHIPGENAPANLIPFVSVGNGADTPNGGTEYPIQAVASGVNARFNGTYSLLGVAQTLNSPGSSRTVTITIKEYEYTGGPATTTTVTRTFTPNTTGANGDLTSGLNGFVSLGFATLPARDIAPDNTASFFTVTVTDSNTSDRWLDLLFIDTSGQLVLVNQGSGYLNYFVDVPDTTNNVGRVLGSQGDRNQAASVLANTYISGGPLLVNPGSNTMLVYAVEGAPSMVATYRPTYRIDRPS